MKARPRFAAPHPLSARGFTLIELLTVIAIIGILAGILIPTLARIRQAASKSTMGSNLRQIGVAVSTFTNDNRDKMPGLYVPGVNAGGLNSSFALGTGQNAYMNYSGVGTEPRSAIQSIDQLGRYITRVTTVVDGVSKLYCPILESPRFATMRNPGSFPPSIELGITVINESGTLVYPFGKKDVIGSMHYSKLATAFSPSRRWMAIEIDKTTPTTVDPTLAGAGWYADLPAQPVHGSGWLAVFFDGHVDFLPPGDARLANRLN